jgi:hypothetical protein
MGDYQGVRITFPPFRGGYRGLIVLFQHSPNEIITEELVECEIVQAVTK